MRMKTLTGSVVVDFFLWLCWIWVLHQRSEGLPPSLDCLGMLTFFSGSLAQVESHVLIFNPHPYGVGGGGSHAVIGRTLIMWVPTLKTGGWRKTSSLTENECALPRRRGVSAGQAAQWVFMPRTPPALNAGGCWSLFSPSLLIPFLLLPLAR